MRTKRQMGEYPGGHDIFRQDFHKGEKEDGSYLKFRSAVEVFSILRMLDYFLNSFSVTFCFSTLWPDTLIKIWKKAKKAQRCGIPPRPVCNRC